MRTQQTVADLEKKVRELSILLEVSRVINSDLEDQSILRTVLEQAMAVIGAEAGTLMVRGALLHDIGKIGIPDSILFKTGPLTFDEREIIKQHVVLGYNMLHHIPFFCDAMPVVLHHHESFDGSGFPNGLKGSDIPLGARIFHVADVYDALVSERPYKRAWPVDRAVAELHQGAGRGYDPIAGAALENGERGGDGLADEPEGFPVSTRSWRA